MESLKKYFGAILVIIAAIILIISHFKGWNNYNGVQVGAMSLLILGILTYIWMNKRKN